MTAAPTPPYQFQKNNTALNHLPGEYGLPYLGKTIAVLKDPCRAYREHHERFGEVSRIGVTGVKPIMLVGPEYAQELIVDRDQNFSAKMGWSAFMKDFFEGGLLLRDFDEHRIHRRIMQSAFKSAAIRDYVATINEIVHETVEAWHREGDFRLFPKIKLLLLRIAFRVFCYADVGEAKTQAVNQAFIDMLEGSLGMVRKDWPGFAYHKGMNGRRFLFDFFKGLVAEKRANPGKDMMSYFCRETKEDGTYFSDEEIAEHMIFLMLAAHDTTSSSLVMAVYHLAGNPQWQARLQAEVDALSGPAVYEDIFGGLPETTHVLYEVLRLHPPVGTLYRRTIRETTLGGYRIPAHTMVLCPIMYNHRLETYWHQPDTFRPERFAGEHPEHKQHPYLWIPFGGGAHKCIGLHFAELLFKTTITELLRGSDLHFCKSDYYPTTLQHFPFTKPADDLPIRLSRR